MWNSHFSIILVFILLGNGLSFDYFANKDCTSIPTPQNVSISDETCSIVLDDDIDSDFGTSFSSRCSTDLEIPVNYDSLILRLVMIYFRRRVGELNDFTPILFLEDLMLVQRINALIWCHFSWRMDWDIVFRTNQILLNTTVCHVCVFTIVFLFLSSIFTDSLILVL